jgi:choline dehydrogenase-like flavoprotein
MTNTYDAIVIGTRQAGLPLAARLTAAGMSVALIERKLFGWRDVTAFGSYNNQAPSCALQRLAIGGAVA